MPQSTFFRNYFHNYSSYFLQPTSFVIGNGFGNHLGTTFINFNQKPLEFFINTFPSIAKCTIESSINAQADQSFNNLSYNVFNIGDINYVDTKAIELFFDIQDSINVLERMFKTAQTCWMDGGKVHTVPLAGRFVKASNALLSMQNGINTLAVEIIVLQHKGRK